MNDFTFYNPTQIEFGKSKENQIGDYIASQNIKKVLLVMGSGSIKRSGLYDKVINSLTKAGLEIEELSGVVSNPLLSKVNDGIKISKEKGVEAVLAVGGGSVVDSAKTIAAGALYDGDVWDFYIKKATIQKALPIFTVMTLSATASEMNSKAVVMNDQTKQKFSIGSPFISPKISVINPELMATVGADYLAYSAVDIIAHSIEVYFTATVHPNFNSRLVESIVKTVMETTEILLADPSNYEARGEFAWAAIQGFNGLTPAGTTGGGIPNHMIEHSLSALYNIAHGAGLAIVIPAWMRWYKDKNQAQFKRFANKIFNTDNVDEAIDRLEQWFSKIGAPTSLAQANIPKSSIPALAKNSREVALVWGLADLYTEEVIEEILYKA